MANQNRAGQEVDSANAAAQERHRVQDMLAAELRRAAENIERNAGPNQTPATDDSRKWRKLLSLGAAVLAIGSLVFLGVRWNEADEFLSPVEKTARSPLSAGALAVAWAWVCVFVVYALYPRKLIPPAMRSTACSASYRCSRGLCFRPFSLSSNTVFS